MRNGHMENEQQSVRRFEEQFAAFERRLNGERTTEFHKVRQRGIQTFARLGFPTARDEEWRFTNVAPIVNTTFTVPVTERRHSDFPAHVSAEFLEDAYRLVFVDGSFDSGMSSTASLPDGVLFMSLREAMRAYPEILQVHLAPSGRPEENAFTALNDAFLLDGGFLSVPQGLVVERPFQFVFIASEQPDPQIIQPRNVLIIGEHAQATVVETYVAEQERPYLTNCLTHVAVGPRAILEHDRYQNESTQAFHVGTMLIRQEAGSVLTSNSINVGGQLVRNSVTAVLAAEGIECTLNGLSLGTASQVIDNHTTIDHANPRCNSHELYKSILDGRARGVFNGKIFVRKDAQKTDAKQTNKTLLLSDEATIDTKPQLEIFADDVKCTHGATVGQLDENQIFYLRSRGIDETAARDILTFAFAADVTERVHVESLRQRLEGVIHARLDRGRRNG